MGNGFSDGSVRKSAAHGALLHDYETPGGKTGGVHLDASLYTAQQRQSRFLDGCASRRGELRAIVDLSISEAETGLWPQTGGSAHQLGCRDCTPVDALGPARIAGDSGYLADHSDQGILAL